MKHLFIAGALILLFSGAISAGGSSGAIPIDALYVGNGFSPDRIDEAPSDTKGWVVLQGESSRKGHVRISELPLENLPVRHIFSLKKVGDRQFTIIAVFTVNDLDRVRQRYLGLLVRQIADNWEIYLNGRLLRSEMHLKKDGSVRISRNVSFVLEYLNPLYLREGRNVLAFRIVGDPTSIDTGFYRVNPLTIDEYPRLLAQKKETATMVLIFVYLFIGFYHLVLFIGRRSEKFNLYYGLFSVMLFLYIFARTHVAEEIVYDIFFLKLLEFCALYTLLPLIGLFFSTILKGKITVPLKVYGAYSLFLILATVLGGIFVPNAMPFAIDILRLWQYTSFFALAYFFLFLIGGEFLRDIRARRGKDTRSLPRVLGRSLTGSVAGNLLLGATVMIFCSVFDILDALYWSNGLVLIQYGFFFFIIGITFVLSNRFLYIHRKIEALNDDLKNRIDELNEANSKISVSEQKYKLLVEGTNDLIFTMDPSLVIHSANKTMLTQLAIARDDLSRITFYDILHETVDTDGVNRAFVTQKIEQFLQDRKPVSLRIDLRSSFGNEPLLMQVRLEYIGGEGKNEILGKAVRVADDALLPSLLSEKQKYRIGNYLMTADDLSHRITRNLNKFFNPRDITLMRIAVREMIINAIEHGNLNISFDEKSYFTMNDEYINFIVERQKHPEYRNRHVHIDYTIDDDRVEYRIRDDGEGFDHRDVINRRLDEANEEMLAHGRGITFAKSIFDEMRYEGSGSEVVLVKYIRKDVDGEGPEK